MKKIRTKNLKYIIIFLIGLSIATYPIVSRKYYEIKANDEIVSFDIESDKMEREEVDRRIKLAQIYNDTLDPSILADPYSSKEKDEARKEYARMLEVHEKIGHVEIPKIKQDLPIYAGTNDDILQKGVGHLEGTSLPIGGNGTHAVLTAHRGLPSAKLFTDLDKMEIGDIFLVHNIQTTLAYKVTEIDTVEPSDFSKVLVVPEKDLVTLLTCTPYMINSHRLLVRGERTDYNLDVFGLNIKKAVDMRYKTYLYISLVIISILVRYYLHERKKRKYEKK